MTIEIPQYGLKAYALLYTKHGVVGKFKQSELNWIVSESMKKKIFSLLLRTGWIKKNEDKTYSCKDPSETIKKLLDFRVPEIMENAEKEYSFTKLSAIEMWSDYSYVQRGLEKSPYFIKILKKDIKYWKNFFNKNNIPNYVEKGQTIGEYVIMIPVNKIECERKNKLKVDTLKETIKYANSNDAYNYATQYIKNKYGEKT